jgi:uncharacterized protein YqgV (UPF0045/DUF77 family)
MLQSIQSEIFNLINYILVTLVGIAVTYVIKFLKDKGLLAKLENHKTIVDMVVKEIEQTLKDTNGAVKFNAAKSKAIQLLSQKGIKVTNEELSTLIENCVKEMNDTVKEATK